MGRRDRLYGAYANVILARYAYTPTDTQGRLIVGDWSCWTIEPPWIRGDYRGGKPFKSCVPDGTYKLIPYHSPSRGYTVLVLLNPALGVYLNEYDRPEDNDGDRRGRFMCQIHAANFADELDGCIAPGNQRIHTDRGVKVKNSRATFIELIKRVRTGAKLEIRQAPGAIDTPLEVAA